MRKSPGRKIGRDSPSLMQKPWHKGGLRDRCKARYIKSHSEVDKKAYQDARNIYLLKLKRAKCLYLNTAVGETQGDQRKLFGLLDSLTKEPGGNPLPLGCDAFLEKKLKLYMNHLIL